MKKCEECIVYNERATRSQDLKRLSIHYLQRLLRRKVQFCRHEIYKNISLINGQHIALTSNPILNGTKMWTKPSLINCCCKVSGLKFSLSFSRDFLVLNFWKPENINEFTKNGQSFHLFSCVYCIQSLEHLQTVEITFLFFMTEIRKKDKPSQLWIFRWHEMETYVDRIKRILFL